MLNELFNKSKHLILGMIVGALFAITLHVVNSEQLPENLAWGLSTIASVITLYSSIKLFNI